MKRIAAWILTLAMLCSCAIAVAEPAEEIMTIYLTEVNGINAADLNSAMSFTFMNNGTCIMDSTYTGTWVTIDENTIKFELEDDTLLFTKDSETGIYTIYDDSLYNEFLTFGMEPPIRTVWPQVATNVDSSVFEGTWELFYVDVQTSAGMSFEKLIKYRPEMVLEMGMDEDASLIVQSSDVTLFGSALGPFEFANNTLRYKGSEVDFRTGHCIYPLEDGTLRYVLGNSGVRLYYKRVQ